jgi:hypothetical protein
MVTQTRVERGPSPRYRPPRRRGGGLVLFGCLLLVAGAAGWVYWHGSVGDIPVREHCTATTGGGTSVDLDPEQMGNAGVIAAVAVRRGLPARAGTIAIATAIQESKLRNISYGDRDSLGLFQQRPSMGWGTPEEVRDPVYASNAFYDVLVKIEGYRNLEITKAAQKVQRSAYPEAYADHEPEARVLSSALSGYSPAGVTCVLRQQAVTGQKPAKDGLTARARTLITTAGNETGRAARGPVAGAGPAGTTVQWQLTGKESGRLGWSLAQWAVSRAQALGVVSVATDGKRWSRDDPGGGWQAVEGQPKPATGTVVVQVAG